MRKSRGLVPNAPKPKVVPPMPTGVNKKTKRDVQLLVEANIRDTVGSALSDIVIRSIAERLVDRLTHVETFLTSGGQFAHVHVIGEVDWL